MRLKMNQDYEMRDFVLAGAPEVHPQVLLRALAPVVFLHLRVEAHVVKPENREGCIRRTTLMRGG
jgi:hypothetical protein